MAGAMQRTAAQVYERELADNSPERPLTCVGRISDIFWDDDDNRFLRGFILVDSELAFGKGLSILNYYHQPYQEPHAAPLAEMDKYAINKYVRVTFEVFDTYREAAGE